MSEERAYVYGSELGPGDAGRRLFQIPLDIFENEETPKEEDIDTEIVILFDTKTQSLVYIFVRVARQEKDGVKKDFLGRVQDDDRLFFTQRNATLAGIAVERAVSEERIAECDKLEREISENENNPASH